MDDQLEEIKERYEHRDGSGCNPAVFDGLSKNGLEIVAQDVGALIDEVERLNELVEKKDKVIKFRVDGQNRTFNQMERLRADEERLELFKEKILDAYEGTVYAPALVDRIREIIEGEPDD